MKTLKKLTLLSCLILGLSLLTFSCKKDTSAPLKTLDGKFAGTFKAINDLTEYPLSFSFNTDNTLILYDIENYKQGSGTWSVNGDVVSGEFIFDANPNSHFSFTSTFNAKTGVLSNGSWGFKPVVTGSATFTVTKQEAERYVGEFVFIGSSGTYPMAMELYPDNSLLYFENPIDLKKPSGSGTYVVVNNTMFAANIKYFASPSTTFAYTATKSSSALVSGSWGNFPMNTGYGTYTVTKK